MASVNGVVDHACDSAGSSAPLGKRKRSMSPEKELGVNGEHVPDLRQALRRKMQALSRYVV